MSYYKKQPRQAAKPNAPKPPPPPPPSSREPYQINLLANYFAITLTEPRSVRCTDLFLYDVVVRDPIPRSRRLRRRAIYCWLEGHRPPSFVATNYHNFLVTAAKFEDVTQADFQYWDEHQAAAHPNHAPTTCIELKFRRQFNITDFLEKLRSNNATDPAWESEKADVLNLLNVIFGQRMNERSFRTPNQNPQFAAPGSEKFYGLVDPRSLTGARNLVVAYSGFLRSTRCSNRLLLNVNNATGAFYPERPLFDLIGSFLNNGNYWPRTDLSTFLSGLRVKTTHLRASNGHGEKIYTINRVPRPEVPDQDRKPTPGLIFFDLNDHNQIPPNQLSDDVIVQCGTQQHPIYLPSRVLEILPGQPFKKPLTGEQSAAMIMHACCSPDNSRDKLASTGLSLFVPQPGTSIHQGVNLGFTVRPDLERVSGQILRPPAVQCQDRIPESFLARGGWNMRDKQFSRSAGAARWTFLGIHFPHGGQNVQYPYSQPQEVAGRLRAAMGSYRLDNQVMVVFPGPEGRDHILRMEGSLNSRDLATERRNGENLQSRLEEFYRKGIRLVVITLPVKDIKLYALIKRVADVHVGIHTICVAAGTAPASQTLCNLLLKYNLKMGGVNHWLGPPPDGSILRPSTMFVGMDVTHPPQDSQSGAPSIAAVVATREPEYFVHWPASIRLQEPDKNKQSRELIDDLRAMLAERLRHWRKCNSTKLPEQIIIYRDGVSDAFYSLVHLYERPKILQAITDVGGEKYKPKIVYILVLKRHSTRFFASPDAGQGRRNKDLFDARGNPMPGLLVPDTLTRQYDAGAPHRGGHFLQSHEALKGTARPIHYVIKLNQTNHSPLEVMRMTHDLCYLFSRATRSVHVHPAILHADLACGRARHYLRLVYNPTNQGQIYNPNQWVPGRLYAPHIRLEESTFYI